MEREREGEGEGEGERIGSTSEKRSERKVWDSATQLPGPRRVRDRCLERGSPLVPRGILIKSALVSDILDT